MIRLHLVVEGQTEETFVRDVLAPDLASHGVIADAHRITTGRARGRSYRGGFVRYEHIRRDIVLWAKEDKRPDSRFTTMIDFYRLPKDFPGLDGARGDPIERAEFLEASMRRDIDDRRFLPFLQVHEFEAFLFSDPKAFAVAFPSADTEIAALEQIRNMSASPEHINEETSPARQICAVLPAYEKVASGSVIAARIGLDAIARECAHFRSWLKELRALDRADQ